MIRKFRQKKFWSALSIYFLFLLTIKLVTDWLFLEKGKPFWVPDVIAGAVIWSLIMSFFFGLFFKPKDATEAEETTEEIRSRNFKYYAGLSAIVFVVFLVLLTILLSIAYLFFIFFTDEKPGIKEMVLVPLVMAIFIALIFGLLQYFGDKRKLRKG